MHENGNGNGHGFAQASILSRFFNITPLEWPRVAECWFITFFFKLGSAIGWTVLTAAFVARFGIAFLPALFVFNAILIIMSTFFFERLIMRTKREVLMVLMLLTAALALLFAAVFYERSMMTFFVLVIIAESIFLAQFNVFLPILVGDRFTPLESTRTFSFVESGDTIGAMIGAALVGILAAYFPIPFFLYLWMIALGCGILVFFVVGTLRRTLPPLTFRVKSAEKREKALDQIKLVIRGIQKFPFLRSLAVVVMFQWMFMNILDFQYTKALGQSVTHTKEATIAHVDANLFRVAVLSSEEGVKNMPAIAQEAPRALTHTEQSELTGKLGKWKGVFHATALLVQVFIAPRLITGLGIVGSMLLHPILLLMSMVGMFLKFGFLSALIARINFESTYAIHKNAYLASHYAFPKFLRDQAAEFLEGMVRPMGTIVGMLFIVGFQMLYNGKDLSMWIHLVMALIMVVVLVTTIRLQPKYTEISRDQLFSNLPYPEKLNAVEILAQRGHENAPFILMQHLQRAEHESPMVRKKIIMELGRLKDFEALPQILESLSDTDPEIRLEAAHALMNFHDVGEKFFTQAFSRYRMVETLKEVFRQEKSAAVRTAIIRIFSILHEPLVIPYLLDLLQHGDDHTRADCIYTIGLFKDPNAAYYILPFLSHTDPQIQSHALIALWQFPQYRQNLLPRLQEMMESSDTNIQKAGIFASGEIGQGDLLAGFLLSADPEIRRETAFALTKCGDLNGFEILLEHLLTVPRQEFETLRRFIHRLRPPVQRTVTQVLHNFVSQHLYALMRKFGNLSIQELPPETLERLRRLYILLEQHEELYIIDNALHSP